MALKSSRTKQAPYFKPAEASDEAKELAKALRKEYKSFVVLYAHSLPRQVAKTALDILGLPWSIFWEPFEQALTGVYHWHTEGVATAILEARDAILGAVVPHEEPETVRGESATLVVFDETGPEPQVVDLENSVERVRERLGDIVLKHTSDHLTMENGIVTVLNDERNPFVDLDPEQTFGAKEAGQLLGRSYGYVKDHGADLGGTKTVRGAWQFTAAALAVAWPTHKGE